MKCGDCKYWHKDTSVCVNADSKYCADFRMHYNSCGKWTGEWKLNEWGEPRERNLAIYQDRENGMKLKEIGEKYGISRDRARCIWYREKRRIELRNKHDLEKDAR